MGAEGEFTAISYNGRDARKAFEAEFLKVSESLSSEAAQIYGLDIGTIPSVVLWHNLVPLTQLVGNVGLLGQRYLRSLHMQWGCWDAEMWLDPSRGVICHGPKGPFSHLPVGSLNIKDLPPTAELLQEDVLMRFLASHKSKEADDVFFDAMYLASDDEDMPEQVDRPTIFSALTKTPIAVANNVWESWEDNLVDRTCLENGITRFRLDGDGPLWLGLNLDAGDAWLSQGWSVLHARGISLEVAREGFILAYPQGWLEENIYKTPSECQRRRQQAIYLFIYPPPPNLTHGKTSLLHHWSFQEDSQPQLSPELCRNLGLPFKLNFNNRPCGSRSWSSNLRLIHQYRLLRGFDSTTTDFARHFGYDRNIFQPLGEDDRFTEVDSCTPESHTNLGKSVNSTTPEDPLDEQDLGPVSNLSSPIDLQAIGDDFAAGSQHGVASKRQRSDRGIGRVQTRTHPTQEFYHKSDTTVYEQAMEDVVASRLIRPLPRRTYPSSLEYSSENQWRVYSHGDTAFGNPTPPSHFFYHHPRISTRGESIPSPIMTFAPPYHIHPAASFRMPHNTAASSFNSPPPFNSYFSQDNNSDTTPDSAYTDPSTYSVNTTPTIRSTSGDGTPERVGWSGLAQDIPSSAVNTFFIDPALPSLPIAYH
ncbi:hypothetical protein PM082_014797 [Marasmius tenuissimus]|nr:hypothetical protein PM082_014797 [Marasmius tenuissimus]